MPVNRLPLLIDSDAVLGSVPPGEMIDALAKGHRRRHVSPARLHAVLPRASRADADVLIWLGARTDGGMGAKFVTVSPDNQNQPGSATDTIHSAVLLCDPVDASIRCFIVGNSFTRYKTAADSVLAARFLAPREPRRLLMIGAGSQATVHLLVMSAEFPSLECIEVWNRDRDRATRFVDQLNLTAQSRVADSIERSAREADIIVCATGATVPVLQGEWLTPGTHVDLVGGYTPQMREADDAALLRSRVYVDHRGLVTQHCGDIAQPLANGVIDAADIVGDLFDLCGSAVAGRQNDDEITLFKNGGGGHLDLMFAEWLASRSTNRERVA